ncbi:50S ribosomal protein L5 [Patescibacteria group bacterium]|nr:50S ribosomal protein L5 [Patescibacteria group bacterium]
MSRLKQKYDTKIASQLMKEFSIKNKMAVPRITKIVVNIGIGNASKNKQLLAQVKKDLADITGQLPQIRKAKMSVASFSIREGMPVGLKVTLRGDRMYSFLDKLFSVVLPRLRDFRGLSRKSFDENGNYTIGIEDYSVFPEMDTAGSQSHGLEVSIVTSTNDKKQAGKLLTLLGMPFEKEEYKSGRV